VSEEPAGANVPRIVAAVFALLVVATIGAFFVAQQLKTAPTVITRVHFTPTHFSPNGDGVKDSVEIKFGVTETDAITVEVVNETGDVVRSFPERLARRYTNVTQLWNGRTDAGRRAPDGLYRIRVTLRDRGRSILVPDAFFLDTRAPRPQVVRIGPKHGTGPQILPRPDGSDAIAFLRAPGRERSIRLFRTSPGTPTLVLTEKLAVGVKRWRWNGRTTDGKRAPAGTYVVVAEVVDRAGNVGTSVPLTKAGLPAQTYGQAYPSQGGITVRYLGVQPPLNPVRAGDAATFFVDARGHTYSWSLHRVARPAVKRSRTTTPQLKLSTPRGPGGLDLLSIRTADGRTGQSPLPIASRTAHRVLVVLPMLTWQGRNAVDDDGDGRPNTLTDGLPIRLARVFAGDGMPVGLASQAAPLLAALDRQGRAYNVTTDVALAQGTGPKLDGHTGVLLAGDARWLPDATARRLRNWVKAGGNLASVGTNALQRYATLTKDGRAVRPTEPTTADLFGARPDGLEPKATELVSGVDKLSLFVGTDGQFGPFTGVERFVDPASMGDGGAVQASATDAGGAPVVLATTFGKGVALRIPIPAFASRLAADPDLNQLLRNTWILLSR
jgi:flagellar hook assembly protein FlgD